MNTVAMAAAPSTAAPAAIAKRDVCAPEVRGDSQLFPLGGAGNHPPPKHRGGAGICGDGVGSVGDNDAPPQREPEVAIRNGVGAHGASKDDAGAAEKSCRVQELARPVGAARRGLTPSLPPPDVATVTNGTMAVIGSETPEVPAGSATAGGDGGLPEVVRHRKQQQQQPQRQWRQRQMITQPVGHCTGGCGMYVVNPVR